MRVAMVSEHASPLAALGEVDAGGQNVHVAELARALVRLGAQVTVYTRRDRATLPARVEWAPGIVVHHVDAGPPKPVAKDELLPYMDAFAEELERAWRAERPDVAHAHFWMSGLASVKAARPLGIPVVQTFHALGVVKRRYQGERDTSPSSRIDHERELIRRADHVIATCTDEVFELVRLGANRARLSVIPCGVDLDVFTPQGQAAPRDPKMARLLTVGRLVERKGVGNVITALAQLSRVELLVAGGPDRAWLADDTEARRLQALADAEGVADRVSLCGRVSREGVAELMRSADAVVAVPWYEPFGIVPLEAMACGVPIVASAVGGMIDTVMDDVTGVQVPPRDPERLLDALAALLGDRSRREAYGSAGAQRARRLYDWRRVAAATIDVYGKLAHERRERPRRTRRTVGFPTLPDGAQHLRALREALERFEPEIEALQAWGEQLAGILLDGGRLLAVGNGGSAAQAEHLTAELVGRYQTERQPLSALCMHADMSSFTAIGNDYGPEEAFARQVRAHGRTGDVLLALSTSGKSPNVLAAVHAARELQMLTWGLCGKGPNPLTHICDEVICAPSTSTATVQEIHMVALHAMCAAIDREIALRDRCGPVAPHRTAHEAALA